MIIKLNENDMLTSALVFGGFSAGNIPRQLRNKNETHSGAKRRRTEILTFIKKRPVEAKACAQKIFSEALRFNNQFYELEKLHEEANEHNKEFDVFAKRYVKRPGALVSYQQFSLSMRKEIKEFTASVIDHQDSHEILGIGA